MSDDVSSPSAEGFDVRALIDATVFIRRVRQAIAPLSLTIKGLTVLSTIHEHDRPHLRDVATALHMAPPDMTSIIAELEQAGLIERTARGQNPDRRMVTCQVTAKGAELLAQVAALRLEPVRDGDG